MARAKIDAQLNMDATRFHAKLRRAETATKGFATNLKANFGALGAALATGSVVRILGDIADKYDRIGKLATRLEIGVEAVQRLGVAAELSGTDFETIAKSMQKANKNALDATNGSKNLERAFNALGIEAGKFLKLDTEGQFFRLAEAFNQLGGSSEARANLAIVAGQMANEIIPALKDAEALKSSLAGVSVLSESEVRNIEHFNDAKTRFKADIAPLLGETLSTLGNALRGGSDVIQAVKNRDYGDIGTQGGRHPFITGRLQQEREDKRLLEFLTKQRQTAVLQREDVRLSGDAATAKRMTEAIARLSDKIGQLQDSLGVEPVSKGY